MDFSEKLRHFTCSEYSCSNTVLEPGEKCFLCKFGLKNDPLKIKPFIPEIYFCSKNLCMNIVSFPGGTCHSCVCNFQNIPLKIPVDYFKKTDSFEMKPLKFHIDPVTTQEITFPVKASSPDYLGFAEDTFTVVSSLQPNNLDFDVGLDVCDLASFAASKWVDHVAENVGKDVSDLGYKACKTISGGVLATFAAAAGLGPIGVLLCGFFGMLIGASAEDAGDDD